MYVCTFELTVGDKHTDTEHNSDRPLLDKTPNDTESIVNRTFCLLQYQLVGAADEQ